MKYWAFSPTCHISVELVASVCPYIYCPPITGRVVTWKALVSIGAPSLRHSTVTSSLPDAVQVKRKSSSNAEVIGMLTRRGHSILAGAARRNKLIRTQRMTAIRENGEVDNFQGIVCLICKLSWTSRPLHPANSSDCPNDKAD